MILSDRFIEFLDPLSEALAIAFKDLSLCSLSFYFHDAFLNSQYKPDIVFFKMISGISMDSFI